MNDVADPVRSVIDAAGEKYGLPQGLLYKMANTESNLDANAVSPKGAQGWFQFMPKTAKAYGLTDPSNLELSSDAAGRYMRDNLKSYGGDLHASLADYNGGPKAVKALRSGMPWKETSGYLDKILGDGSSKAYIPAGENLSPQFTSIVPQERGMNPDASALSDQRALQDSKKSITDLVTKLPGDIAAGFKLDNSVYNYWKTSAISDFGPEQILDNAGVKETLDGVSPDHWDYILQGRNNNERALRKGRVLENLKIEEEMASHGWGAGTIGRILGGLPDIPTLMAFVPIIGGEGLMTSAGRVGNAARLSLMMGGTNAAYEAATYKNKPLGTTNDIWMSGLMGLGMGALTGGLSNPARFALHADNKLLEQFARKEYSAAHLKELEEAGVNISPAYRQYLEGKYESSSGSTPLDNIGVSNPYIGNSSENSVGKLGDVPDSNGNLPGSPNYNERSLTGIGSDANRRTNRQSPDGGSLDINPATAADMNRLKKTQYASDDLNIVSARSAVIDSFGKEVAEGLENSGRVKFIPAQNDLPESLRHADGVNAFYDPITDTSFILADRINKDNVRGILLHDVGVHQGLERVVGTDLYNKMILTVERLARDGDAAAVRAIERASRSPTKDFLKAEERLAYYIEHTANNKSGLIQDILFSAKKFLSQRFGVNFELTGKDLVAIAQGSLKAVSEKGFGSYNNGLSHVWHGSAVKGIDKLSTDFVGTGEGNVNQGWGLYTSQSKYIGNWYRTKEAMFRGMRGEDGGLYQLKVNGASPDHFLRWDSTHQSSHVLKALGGAGIESTGKSGRDIYFGLMKGADGATALEKAKSVSQQLDALGITGNAYTSGGSRGKAITSDNHVFFNSKNLDVSARYSVGEDLSVPKPSGSSVASEAGMPGVAPADISAANKAGLSATVFGWGLGLEHTLGGKGAWEGVKSLSAKLIGTTVGYADHSVVKAHAWDMTTMLNDSWKTKLRKDTYPAFEEWFTNSGRSSAEKGRSFDEFGEKVSNYIRGVDGEFDTQVIKVGDSFRSMLNEVRENINNPSKFYGGKKLGLTETIIKDVGSDIERIIGTLEQNPFYLPRKHDITKWNNMIGQFSRESVEGWWSRAYQSGREGVTDESAKKWAGWYMRTVEDAHVSRTQDLLTDLLQGTDKEALRQSLIRNGGYSEAESYAVLADMFPTRSTDSGTLQSSLKHRNTINEKYTEKLQTADGQTLNVGLNDFTHSNAFDLVEPYLRRTAGSVALAHHADVYKNGDILKAIQSATPNEFGKDMKMAVDLKKYRENLQFVFDRIQGLPQEEFTAMNKSLEMWRDFNVIRLMGGTVWNQATEMSQIVGSLGWNTMLKAMPELEKLTRDIKTGRAPHDILEHLENTIGGAGSDYVRTMEFKPSDDWVRNKGDTAWNRRLDALDTKVKQFAKGTLDYTGMTPMMIQQKRIHAIALVNHFVTEAKNTSVSKGIRTAVNPSTFLTEERLAWMGLGKEEYSSVLSSLKKYSSDAAGEYASTSKLDTAKWVKEDPTSHANFMTAIHRETRRVIQENDLSSMIPIMGETLGKTVFQFMNFSLHGWNKSLMFSMNHRDMSTLSTVLHGGLFAGLAYSGRTMLASAGMNGEAKDKFLKDRMNTKQLVANSIGKTSQASILPNLYDATMGNITGPMFSGMRTTSDVAGLASNPTLGAVNGVLSLGKMVKNGVSGTEQTTQKDIKQWGKLLPLNNVVPVSTLLNHLANSYPTSGKEGQ